tara:strand:- start:12684 stop:13238 length:555 start_codon:yes stop_codon:yes gene_type:complete
MTWSAQERSQKQTLLAVCFGILICSVAWSVWYLDTKVSAAQDSAKQLEESLGLAEIILKGRSGPSRAALRSTSSMEMTEQIEQASKDSELPAKAIALIEPQAERRVGNTPYKLQLTRLDLNALPLDQLVVFLRSISSGDSSLIVNGLRLSAPVGGTKGSQQTETWLSEVTLTRIVYAPITRSPL